MLSAEACYDGEAHQRIPIAVRDRVSSTWAGQRGRPSKCGLVAGSSSRSRLSAFVARRACCRCHCQTALARSPRSGRY